MSNRSTNTLSTHSNLRYLQFIVQTSDSDGKVRMGEYVYVCVYMCRKWMTVTVCNDGDGRRTEGEDDETMTK